jgi:hypothetical protein
MAMPIIQNHIGSNRREKIPEKMDAPSAKQALHG